ncbi:MAG: GNAT family acetyltransferase [Phycisphaerales bacterium]|nr:GNAT family acetyltransferase [Phycisphaerales bacterium]
MTDEDVTLHIRPYRDDDQPAVIALWHVCNLVVQQNDQADDIARKLRVQRHLFLIGTINDDIVATVMAGYEGHRGWINYLAIHPNRRGCSFGRTIMNHAEELLRNEGCPKINLQVRETNADVIAFYKHLGYSNDHVVSLGKRL